MIYKKLGRWLIRNAIFAVVAAAGWEIGFVRFVTYIYAPFALLYLAFLLFFNRFISNKMKGFGNPRQQPGGQQQRFERQDDGGTEDTDYEEVE